MGFRLEAEGASTSVSIGLVSHPEDGGTADELVRAADRAMYNAKSLGKNQISGYPRPPRLAGPVAPVTDEEPESGPSGAPVSVPIGEPMPTPSAAAASGAEEAGAEEGFPEAAAVAEPGPEPVATAVAEPGPEPVAAEAPEQPQADHEPEERWTPVPDLRPRRISLAIAEQPDEEEPDAAEVRRQIAVATRSFDPDHQIRRAMDAFLSPPTGSERRPD